MINIKTQGFFKNLVFFWVLMRAYFKRNTLRVRRKRFVFLGLLLLILIGLSYWKFYIQPVKVTLEEGIVGTYTEDNLPPIVTKLLSQGLLNVDPSGRIEPALVSSWESNPEATIYTLKLRDNAFWVDGTPVEASDIDVSIGGAELSVLDEKTLQFKVVDSYSPFLSLLDRPVFKKGSKVGTGPFKIVRTKKSQIFVSRVFLESADKELPNLVIRFFDSEEAAKASFKLGEVDSLISINDIDEFKNQKTVKEWSKTNYQQLVTIFYNTRDPVLSDENIRLALSFAAPSIPGETEAKTSIPPISWAFNPLVKDYLDNKDQFDAYLKKVQQGKDSTITLTATTFLKDVGKQVVEAWKERGLKAELKIESGIPQNFQALLITQNIPEDPDQYSLWHSTQIQTNVSKYESKRVDKDLEDGRKVSDMEVRKARYQDFQKILLDESPATFLYFPKFQAIYREKAEAAFKKVILLQI